MTRHDLYVPVALLLDKELHPSTKLLWMAKRLGPATTAELQRRTGLSRTSVKERTKSIPARHHGGPQVKLPIALLAESAVGAQAKLLYGLLQTTDGYRHHSGYFSLATLCEQTGFAPNTVKLAISVLRDAGWILTAQSNRLSRIDFTLTTPAYTRNLAEIAIVKRRLKRGKFEGESLAQEWLTLLIDSNDFTDNARPGFLVNPDTDERLELDRFYPPKIGFEFHGSQHDRESDKFPTAKVKEQQRRDYYKAGLCLYNGIHLVILRAEDLTLEGMLKRIDNCLPLRDLTGKQGLIDFLEEESWLYRIKAKAAQRSGR